MENILSAEKYDDADFHYGAEGYPGDVGLENGATHIGMFLGWVIKNGLEGEYLSQECATELAQFRARTRTGREILIEQCDEKLTSEDLNDEANAFASAHYDTYLADYDTLFEGKYKNIYYVEDSWENFDLVCDILDKRYTEWKASLR